MNCVEKKTYVFENDTIYQKIYIEFINVKEIYFKLTVKNKINHETSSISDTAKIEIDRFYESPEDNVDIDFDEIAEMPYKTKIFFWKKNCYYIGIHIDYDKKDRVSIVETDECWNYFNPKRPFRSIGTMRLID